MIQWILIISLYNSGMSSNTALSVNSLSSPFYTEEECSLAGQKIKSGLIEGLTKATANVSFVCVKRTSSESSK